MAYSLDSVYKAAEESRARRAAEEAELEKQLTASLRTWKPPSFDPRPPTEIPRAPLPTVEEVEAIRAEAARLGMESGHATGYAEGKQEGYSAGHLEGMQIAIFAVMRMDASVPRTTVAQMCCDLAFKGENLRKIVVGRQMLATVCMVSACVFTMHCRAR